VRRRAGRTLGWALAAVAFTGFLAACTGDSSSSPSPPPETSSEPATTPAAPVDLSFGVYGSPNEVAAYATMAKHFDSVDDRAEVTVEHWPGHTGLRHALEKGEPLPDVFLVSRRDLRWYLDNQLTRPVDTLLDERGVDFGDVYSRDAVTAFSVDNRLQCMPYGVAPQVVYYNTDLVDFDRMEVRGLDVPGDTRRWNWEQFVTAAKFASRPDKGTKGVSVEPTLSGIAPFVYSGGGDLFDDDIDPTSLAFNGEGTQSALQTALELFRDPKQTLTEAELAERSPLKWFEQGKLGMIIGSRALVPQLRKVPALHWDVIAIPSIESGATTGEITGLCISQDAESPATAADFMVYATSTDAVTEVARRGYLQPANQEVAFSDDFLQPDEDPSSATVFNESLGRMEIPPLLDTWDQLDEVVAPFLDQLFYGAPILDLAAVTAEIDAASQPILSPETSTPSPTDSPTESASESASE
jgi:multiple sugar transport system substrate-binding protein